MKDGPLTRAEAALDAYDRTLAVLPEGRSYRGSRLLTRMTVNCLLQDLADYADRHRITIDSEPVAALASLNAPTSAPEHERPPAGYLQVDDAVETIPRSAALPPTCGFVSAIHHADNGSLEYSVAFPGVPTPIRLPRACLRSTKPFPGVNLRQGAIARPSEAEQRLVDAWARTLQKGREPDPRDLTDRTVIAIALGQWAGVPAQRVTEALKERIIRAAAEAAVSSPKHNATQIAASDLPAHSAFQTGQSPSAEPRPHPPMPPARSPRP
ncbi:hypothetical protein AB0L06_31155 [Spirillospora sp. NPDC052269]